MNDVNDCKDLLREAQQLCSASSTRGTPLLSAEVRNAPDLLMQAFLDSWVSVTCAACDNAASRKSFRLVPARSVSDGRVFPRWIPRCTEPRATEGVRIRMSLWRENRLELSDLQVVTPSE